MTRVALITGAARRIGQSLALALAEDGWQIALHVNTSIDEGNAVAATIKANGGKAQVFAADLADEAATAVLIPAVSAAFGPVSLLVNNASIFERDEALTVTRASWDAHLDTNLRAPFVLSQAMAKALPNDQSGLIVNIIDQRVWNLTPHFFSYTLSKAALWAMTQTLALALAPRIRVNAIGPGPTLPSVRQTQAQFDAQCAALPLGRGTNPSEIAAALRFIIAAPAMTGQMIALDGGEHMGYAQASHGFVPEE